jgi:hypothetical protein
MVSSSCSTSGRGRVILVMATVPALLVTEVVLFLRVIRPLPLVEQDILTITRVIRPLPLVEQELLTINRDSCDGK